MTESKEFYAAAIIDPKSYPLIGAYVELIKKLVPGFKEIPKEDYHLTAGTQKTEFDSDQINRYKQLEFDVKITRNVKLLYGESVDKVYVALEADSAFFKTIRKSIDGNKGPNGKNRLVHISIGYVDPEEVFTDKELLLTIRNSESLSEGLWSKVDRELALIAAKWKLTDLPALKKLERNVLIHHIFCEPKSPMNPRMLNKHNSISQRSKKGNQDINIKYGQDEFAKKLAKTILTDDDSDTYVFLHHKSLVYQKGSYSTWCKGKANCFKNTAKVKNALRKQHVISPDLRTFNELLIAKKASGANGSVRHVSFSFGETNTEDGSRADEHVSFSEKDVSEAIGKLTFTRNLEKREVQKELERRREAIGLDFNALDIFNIGKNSPLRVSASEVRNSLQILMLWSRTFKWNFIHTFHLPDQFNLNSSYVVTICTSTELNIKAITKQILEIVNEFKKQIDDYNIQRVAKLSKVSLKELKQTDSVHIDGLADALRIGNHRGRDLWSGVDAFFTIDWLRKKYFFQQFEGVPESFCFILGHPGLIERPLTRSNPFLQKSSKLGDLRHSREFFSGALDVLTIVDIFSEKSLEEESLAKLDVYSSIIPQWARTNLDNEQELPITLSRLSQVYEDTIVIGIECKNKMLAFRKGELVCMFDGSWSRVKTYEDIFIKMREETPATLLPEPLSRMIPDKRAYLSKTVDILQKIAYGPNPRSIILGFDLHPEIDSFKKSRDIFKYLQGNTEIICSDLQHFERTLYQATKSDGAIIITYVNNQLIFRNQVRITLDSDGDASGTGQATAKSLGGSGQNYISFKVSQDGGLKIYYKGNEFLGADSEAD